MGALQKALFSPSETLLSCPLPAPWGPRSRKDIGSPSRASGTFAYLHSPPIPFQPQLALEGKQPPKWQESVTLLKKPSHPEDYTLIPSGKFSTLKHHTIQGLYIRMDNHRGQKNSLASTPAPSQIYFSQEKFDGGGGNPSKSNLSCPGERVSGLRVLPPWPEHGLV